MKNKSILKEVYIKYLKYSKEPVSFRIFSKFINIFFKKTIRKIIEDGYILRLNYSLGAIRIKKFKSKNIIDLTTNTLNKKKLRINWNESIKLFKKDHPELNSLKRSEIQKKMAELSFKRVYHFNEHTDGYIVRWLWERKFRKFRNKGLYTFVPIKQYKTLLAKTIKKNNDIINKYLED